MKTFCALLLPLLQTRAVQAPAGAEAPTALSSDGFPVLPEVSKVLGSAKQTVRGLSGQTAALEKHLAQAERDETSTIAREKAAFEGKLKAQELQNRGLAAQNAQTTKEIKALQTGNAHIREHAKQVCATNDAFRKEYAALQDRLGAVQDFVKEVLTSTDDSQNQDISVLSEDSTTPSPPANAPELSQTQTLTSADDSQNQDLSESEDPATPSQPAKGPEQSQKQALTSKDDSQNQDLSVSEDTATSAQPAKGIEQPRQPGKVSVAPPASPKRNVVSVATKVSAGQEVSDEIDTDDLEDDDGQEDDDSPAPALIAIREERRVEGPGGAEAAARDLIKALRQGVVTLSEQGRAAREQMKALFLSSFKAGEHHHEDLFAEQQKLNSTHASLVAMQGRLQKADKHCGSTQAELSQRLHTLGAHLQKLALVAQAPAAEAAKAKMPDLLTFHAGGSAAGAAGKA